MLADHALDREHGPGPDAGDPSSPQEHDDEAARLVDHHALDRRRAGPRLHAERTDAALDACSFAPLNLGDVLLVRDPSAGVTNDTTGAAVSTTNVFAELVPVLPALSD